VRNQRVAPGAKRRSVWQRRPRVASRDVIQIQVGVPIRSTAEPSLVRVRPPPVGARASQVLLRGLLFRRVQPRVRRLLRTANPAQATRFPLRVGFPRGVLLEEAMDWIRARQLDRRDVPVARRLGSETRREAKPTTPLGEVDPSGYLMILGRPIRSSAPLDPIHRAPGPRLPSSGPIATRSRSVLVPRATKDVIRVQVLGLRMTRLAAKSDRPQADPPSPSRREATQSLAEACLPGRRGRPHRACQTAGWFPRARTRCLSPPAGSRTARPPGDGTDAVASLLSRLDHPSADGAKDRHEGWRQ
jgi:hypothetical protein